MRLDMLAERVVSAGAALSPDRTTIEHTFLIL
jgi:hypothetical protein